MHVFLFNIQIVLVSIANISVERKILVNQHPQQNNDKQIIYSHNCKFSVLFL